MGKFFQAWNVILVLIFAILFFAVVYPIIFIFKASFVNPETGLFSLQSYACLLYTSPSPRDRTRSRMPSSA